MERKGGYKMMHTAHMLGKDSTKKYMKELITFTPVWVFLFSPCCWASFLTIMRPAVKISK